MTVHSTSPACHRSKQIRIGGSRSKNGCSTCKIRRVKCDESRPDCTRCTSTGRQCDGYAFAPRMRIRGWRQYHEMPVAPPARPLAYHSFSTSARGWEYFYYCCFDQVFGGSQFKWIKPLIIQLGHQEDAVMSAVAAFSSMHETAFQTLSIKSPAPKHLQASPVDNSTFFSNSSESVAAISYYAAVKALQHAIDQHGRVAIPAALVCCILFAALNMVQGDYDGAVCHIEHGLGILAREQSIERSGGTLCLPGWSSTAADGVMSVLVAGFYRLAIAAFFYGRTETLLQDHIAVAAAPRTGRHPDGVVPFGDMDEARVSLSTLAGNTLKFAAEVSRYRDHAIPPPPGCFQRRDERLDQLHSWNASFRATPTTTSSETPDEIGLRMVQIVLESQFLALVILLRACLDPDESGYDSCFDQFRSILVLCEEYVELFSASSLSSSSVGPPRNVKTFTFDMEILPQLWLVGKKCRHREHRRRCISLLEKYHRKEGVWDPRLICRLAKRTMEIEESALAKGSISLPENSDRLWTVDLDSRHANSSLAAFAYKPTALGGRGLSWEEMILFGEGTGPVTEVRHD